jgi:metallophosphoesterase superfamily enzyme
VVELELEWSFVEKTAVVSAAHLDANTSYPQQGIIACEIVRRSRDDAAEREIVRISSERPWFVESVDGSTEFDVLRDALVEFN